MRLRRRRRRRPGLAIRANPQKRAHTDAAEGVVLHDDGAARGHVERLALQTVDRAILYRHRARTLYDESVAPHDAQFHAVQHKFMVDLDVVHRTTGYRIAEAAADHVEVADVELLEGLRLRYLDATVVQSQGIRVNQIGEREGTQLTDPHVLECDRLDVAAEHEARHHVDAAVPHGDTRTRALPRQLEALFD